MVYLPLKARADVVFVLAMAAGAALIIVAGPVPQLLFPSDLAAYLDACYRSSLHQVLGSDFSSPIGPAAILPTTVGMRLVGVRVAALTFGACLNWVVYGLSAWLVARRRMKGGLAVAFAIFVAATAAAPYTLDFGSWRVLSYSLLYNRLAWATLCLCLPLCLLPAPNGARTGNIPAILGAATAWIWEIKPNYLLILFFLVIYAFAADKRRRVSTWLGYSVAGAVVVLVGTYLAVPFSPAGYVATHLGMAREAPPALLYETFIRSLRENALWVAVIGASWAIALASGGGRSAFDRISLIAVLSITVASTFIANITNCQFSEIPMWPVLGFLAAVSALGSLKEHRMTWITVVAGMAMLAVQGWQPLASLGYSLARRLLVFGHHVEVRVASPAWSGISMAVPPSEAADSGDQLFAGGYANRLNAGLSLMRAAHCEHKRCLCLDWINPFPFANQSPPITGDEIAWHFGRTVGPKHHPDAAFLASQADVIMEPIQSIQPNSLEFKRGLFMPSMAGAFVVFSENSYWRLWIRRDTP